jgi:GH35 family endo-1,4-beta-xylanase
MCITRNENLGANGVPIDGIGCQTYLVHARPKNTPPEHVQVTPDKPGALN